MKPITIQLHGKGWNARAVTSMTEEVFIADKAHAIDGYSATENEKALQEVYSKCEEAVNASK